MGKKLYVRNLSYKVTEEDLKDLFKEFETATEVNLVTDRATGRSRGFGFVEFSSDDDADKAIKSLNGKTFQDREIVVNEAQPRRNGGFLPYDLNGIIKAMVPQIQGNPQRLFSIDLIKQLGRNIKATSEELQSISIELDLFLYEFAKKKFGVPMGRKTKKFIKNEIIYLILQQLSQEGM